MAKTIAIRKMKTLGTFGKVKAYFTISLGALEIDDCRLIEGTNGLFVGFPSKNISKDPNEAKYIDLVKLARTAEGKLTDSAKTLYDEIFGAARAEYERRSGETLQVETQAAASSDNSADDLPF